MEIRIRRAAIKRENLYYGCAARVGSTREQNVFEEALEVVASEHFTSRNIKDDFHLSVDFIASKKLQHVTGRSRKPELVPLLLTLLLRA